jgi:hypothetical protein
VKGVLEGVILSCDALESDSGYDATTQSKTTTRGARKCC